jgi:hypothetical protein
VTENMILIVAISTLAFAGVLGALAVVQSQRREQRYLREENRATFESYRRFTEEKLYKLTEQLLANGDRWRDVNHLLLDSQSYQQRGTDPSVKLIPYLKSAGLTESDLEVDPRLVVVLTPFHEDFEKEFRVIVEVCRNLGLTAVRGDEEYQPRDILTHVLRLLVRARLVIANLDGRNPNVYYELGIAHALNKPTILVGSSVSELPFDMRSRKVVLAEDPKNLRVQLQAEISRSLI